MPLNFNTLKTPGVYIDEVSLLPPSVAAVETAVPAFIGYTGTPTNSDLNYDTDIKLKAIKIFSLGEYEEYFGKPQNEKDNFQIILEFKIPKLKDENNITSEEILAARSKITLEPQKVGDNDKSPSPHIMHYAVQWYFRNGGGPCYIISVDQYTDTGSISKSDLDEGLEVLRSEDEPTLIVFPEAISTIDFTATDPDYSDYSGLYSGALNQAKDLKDRFVLIDVPHKLGKRGSDDIAEFRKNKGALGQESLLRYGAAYYPPILTTLDYYFGEVIEEENIREFEEVPVEVVVKNHDGTEVEEEADKNKVLIAWGFKEGEAAKAPQKIGDLNPVNNLFYQQAQRALSSTPLTLPPSPGIAGIYNKVDNDRGVWKAPANVSLAEVVAPQVKINRDLNDIMNIDPTTGMSIAPIRNITGRGIVVWGARTLDGNNNEWRYISVRRFFNFVEESVKKASYRFVFEPNDANTWNTLRAMIENFLTIQWNLGALQGAKADQAFFVRVGLGQTMTAQDILEGRLIVEIGMAVVRPAEFIILRFMHKLPEA